MRRKFDIVIGILVALAAVPIVSKILHDGLSTAYLFVHLGQIGVILAVGLWCKKLICDPYVETVERMEAMAVATACPVGCTTHGVCDPIVGQCMCPLTRTGASCSELALPACAVHGQPLRPTFLLHRGWERQLSRDEWVGPLTCS